MSGCVVNQRRRLLTGSRYEITYISARTRNSNGILTTTPTFSRSSNPMELFPILLDVSGSRKSKMAAVKAEMHVCQLVVSIITLFLDKTAT